MQESRREFAKKAGMIAVGTAVAAGTTVLAATGESVQADSNNGVVVGSSNKKEILYKKTAAWDEFYKTAK